MSGCDAVELLTPTDGMVLRQSACLQPGVYVLPAGISIDADGLTLDGNGATIIGAERQGTGIAICGRRNVTICNLRLLDYYHGIAACDAAEITLRDNQISGTAEVPANTVFLDIWRDAANAYGAAILLQNVSDAQILGNDLQHQMNGLLAYGCRRLTVRGNNAGYCSGFGFYLHETCESLFEENYADYCCRYQPRDSTGPRFGAEATGHVGADAAGFVIVHSSCRNIFRRNFARLSGDGFFLAGLRPDGKPVACNENLFEENDASYSPNIAFEATFSAGNVFRGNRADYCNFGFWLGFSRDGLLERNRVVHNRQAGLAVENGINFTVRDNHFQNNHHAGILLWSTWNPTWYETLPDQRTSHHWLIAGNQLIGNGVAIAIRAARDHGIRLLPPEIRARAELRPHDHQIRTNHIQDNRVGIHLASTDRTLISGNTFHNNVEAHLRLEDDAETVTESNLGLRGAYL